MIKPRIIVIPKIYSSGGTRQYLINLLEYLHSKDMDPVILLSKSYLDNELSKIFKSYNFDHHTFNEHVSFENILRKLGCYSPFRVLLNFKKFILAFYYHKKYRSEGFFFSEWNAVWDFIFLLLPGKKYFVVHSYPLRKVTGVMANFLNFYVKNNSVRIASVSNYSAKRIDAYWFSGQDNGINIPNFSKFENISDDSKAVYHSENLTVLTAGHLVKYKNPDLWLKTAQKIISRNPDKKIKFIWIGEGELYSYFKQYETEKINFIGNTNEIETYFSKGTVYFQPSFLESQGIAVLEAMNYGLPCVVSNAGGLPESVKDNYNGYVFSLDDDEAVASKIEAILFNEDIWRKFSLNGIRFYNENFSKNKWYESMDSFLGVKHDRAK